MTEAKPQAVAQANLEVASTLKMKLPTLWSEGESQSPRS